MMLAKYLADYIEHEKFNFATIDYAYGDKSVEIDANDLQKVIQQGIEAFESTEGVTLTVLEKGTIRNKITGKRHRI